MGRPVSGWQVAGFLFTSIAGTLLHFLYDWSGQNIFVGLFSAVNESIWEHMKLIYFPMAAFALLESRYIEDKRFWCIKLVGILSALTVIPVLYYTYTGALGVSADWFNIAIFFLAAGITFYLETKIVQSGFQCPISSRTAVVLIGLIGLLFFVLTFYPPQIPLFADPQTGNYGAQW